MDQCYSSTTAFPTAGENKLDYSNQLANVFDD